MLFRCQWPAVWAIATVAVFARGLSAQRTITVFAAASLTGAFTELGTRFEADHPGVRVRFNFAGSQQLALQLNQGARADVFASADERWMNAVRERGLIQADPVPFAENRLVVILPLSNPGGIADLADLARPGVKLVIAADAVPVGRYTIEVLDRLAATPGFGSDYAGRVLANVVSFEDNVKGIVAKVELGEADAGLVYQSDATAPGAGRLSSLTIPEAANARVAYPLALLKGSASPVLGRAFAELVLSDGGREILARWGLIPGPRVAEGLRQ